MALRSPTKRNKNNIIEAQKGLMRPKLPWQRHPQPHPHPQPQPQSQLQLQPYSPQHHSHVQSHNASSRGIPGHLWALLAMATNRSRVQLPEFWA